MEGTDKYFSGQRVQVFHLSQVHTRWECPVARATEHNRPQVFISTALAHPFAEGPEYVEPEQIKAAPALYRKGGNGIGPLYGYSGEQFGFPVRVGLPAKT